MRWGEFVDIIERFFKKIYYNQNYNPTSLNFSNMQVSKDSYFIKGIPHISYKDAYCHSAVLQMIHGGKKDIGYYNWIIGFTYGAFYNADIKSFIPYADPEPLIQNGCKYLGLKGTYYTVKNSDKYIKAIEYYISNNIPVKVPVNFGVIKNEKFFDPHTELIVGYDKDNFYYYEPGIEDKYEEDYLGDKIKKDFLLKAVESIGKEFCYPWKYALMVFEDNGNKNLPDDKDLFLRNSQLLKGKSSGPYAEGAQALERFANGIKNYSELEEDGKHIVLALEQCTFTRKSNGDFLMTLGEELKPYGDYLIEASKVYEEAKFLFQESSKNHEKAGDLVLKGCNLEEMVAHGLKRYYNTVK